MAHHQGPADTPTFPCHSPATALPLSALPSASTNSTNGRRSRRIPTTPFTLRMTPAPNRSIAIRRSAGVKSSPAPDARHDRQVLKKKKPRKSENLRGFVTAFGGDGGIRTLDPGFGPDAPLAGECLRPLGHVSQTFARTREAVRRERNNIGFRTARQFP